MTTRKPKPTTPTSFSIFWEQVYPRKEGKAAAEKKWNSLKLSALDLIPIARWVDKAMLSKQWKDPQFIPHAATFLHQRRWESDPPPMAHVEVTAHANGETRYLDPDEEPLGVDSPEYKAYLEKQQQAFGGKGL